MYAGGEGDDVRRWVDSVLICSGRHSISRVLKEPCEASGGESLRFLLGDVVKVKKALFPFGNKAGKGAEEEGAKRTKTHKKIILS